MQVNTQVAETSYGYYAIVNKPTKEELEAYYSQAYYQKAADNYQQTYSEDEIKYFQTKIAQKYQVIQTYLKDNTDLKILDVGCGEGWTLDFYQKKGWSVTGLDYSSFACEKFNPASLQYFIVGDIYENLTKLIEDGQRYDVIWLDNVLEHVLDPEQLLNQLKSLIRTNGVLVVEVPNDFSVIQQYALDNDLISGKFWIAYPDHMSYFNKNGLVNLLAATGWKSLRVLADYPIDWNLLNPDSNYIADKAKGKNCHRERIMFENLLSDKPANDVLAFYESMANLGLGRQITGFFTSSI